MSLSCRLDVQDVLSLQQTGPFTRDPLRVKLILDIDRVKKNLNDWMKESLGFVSQCMRRQRTTDVRSLTVALIARTQAGRPNVRCGGRTHFELLKPILDCDTKSNWDAMQIEDYTRNNVAPGDPGAHALMGMIPMMPAAVRQMVSEQVGAKMANTVRILRGDGQSLITMANNKKRDPATFGNVVPANGGFHTCGHFAFGCNEGWHNCKLGRSKDILGIQKVPEHVPNFENDAYKHVTTFMRIDYIGTLSYFLLDVEDPPPELLLDDPIQYLALLQSAGGIVAFESMRYEGVPLSQYIMAARAADGDRNVDLEAYAFHVQRAWAHKPVEARVLLISALSTQATRGGGRQGDGVFLVAWHRRAVPVRRPCNGVNQQNSRRASRQVRGVRARLGVYAASRGNAPRERGPRPR